MRIISKWKDYYDNVQSLGQDQSLLFVRNLQEIPTQNLGLYGVRGELVEDSAKLTSVIVGFCGKFYPAVISNRLTSTTSKLTANLKYVEKRVVGRPKTISDLYTEQIYFYDLESVLEFTDGKMRSGWGLNSWRHDVTEFFHRYSGKEDDTLFHKYRTPIFVHYEEEWFDQSNRRWRNRFIVCDCLEQHQFFKVIDPYTAYQELAM